MIVFSEEFFKDETREDFFISETMKRFWAANMEVLQVVADICKKHNLTWYADWGTLLGTVRHKGFIPWDDDIDIAMKREDYQKLIEILPQELPEGYCVYSHFYDEGYLQQFLKVANGHVFSIDKEWLERYHGCPFSVSLDIFPLDYMPRDKAEADAVKSVVEVICDTVAKIREEKPVEEYARHLSAIENFFEVKLDCDKPLCSQVWRLMDQLCMAYDEEDSDEIVQWRVYAALGKGRCPKSCYEEVTWEAFENIQMPVPCGYDAILKSEYGDYMTRVRGQASHDYPAYKDQVEFMKHELEKIKREQGEIKEEQREIKEDQVEVKVKREIARTEEANRKEERCSKLTFPSEFFQAQVREDFLVDQTMKTVWAAELETLAVISEICEKHNLQFYLDYGSLLGAVRHKGFIPWDDDMDIAMKRSDYMKLMKVLPEELPEGWRVMDPLSEEGHIEFWACINNSGAISVDEKHLRQFHNCPFIVGIDIFPLDYLPGNPAEMELQRSIFRVIWRGVTLSKIEEKTAEDEAELEEALVNLEEICHYSFDRNGNIRKQLWRLANLLAMSYGEEDSDQITMYYKFAKQADFILDKSCYEDTVMLPFENVLLPAPIGYDEVLKKEYGDYMVPVQNTQSHDYPYYKKQLEMLRAEVQRREQLVQDTK